MPKKQPRVGVKSARSKTNAAIPPPPAMKSKEPPVVESMESKNPKAMSKKMPKKEC